jgi:PEP-CTERM motif
MLFFHRIALLNTNSTQLRLWGSGMMKFADLSNLASPMHARSRLAVLAGCIALSGAATAHAATITYTFTGFATGNLDGAAFNDAAFKVTEVGDTENIVPPGGPNGEFSVPIDSTSFTVGTSSGSFDGPDFTNAVVLNPSPGFPAIVFSQGSPAGGVAEGLINSAFETYNLAGSFPLTSGTPSFITQVYQTSAGGLLEFDSASSVSFQATGGVPEPATWAMMLVGFGGLGAAMRGRRRVSTSATTA